MTAKRYSRLRILPGLLAGCVFLAQAASAQDPVEATDNAAAASQNPAGTMTMAKLLALSAAADEALALRRSKPIATDDATMARDVSGAANNVAVTHDTAYATDNAVAPAEIPVAPAEMPVAPAVILLTPVKTPVTVADMPIAPPAILLPLAEMPVAPAVILLTPVKTPVTVAEMPVAPPGILLPLAQMPVAPAAIPLTLAELQLAPAEIPVTFAKMLVAPAVIPLTLAELQLAPAELPLTLAKILVAPAVIPLTLAELQLAPAEIPLTLARTLVTPAVSPLALAELQLAPAEIPVTLAQTPVARAENTVSTQGLVEKTAPHCVSSCDAMGSQPERKSIFAANEVSDGALGGMRAGFFNAAGAEFDFGASVSTLVNGELALQSTLNWTPTGLAVQQVSGSTPIASMQPDPLGVQAATVAGGQTQVISNLANGQIQNFVINSASNQNISQNTNVQLTIYNFADWQRQMAQSSVAATLAANVMSAAGLGGSH